MRDTQFEPGREPDDVIVIAQVNQSYWLLQGERHLSAMLSGLKPFPKPVRCVQFETLPELNVYLPEGLPLSDLWGINPLIIDRLRRENNLLEIDSRS